jgi:hypothetical protein
MKCLYYPQYFRATRPYYNNAFVANFIAARADGQSPAHRVLMDAIWTSAQACGVDADVRQDQLLFAEAPIAETLAVLESDGTPLYDIAPTLLEALSHSETGDMCLADIRSPNRTYFLHWGAQAELLLAGANPVEGAVVVSSERDWRIALVSRTSDRWCDPRVRDCFVLDLPERVVKAPFAEAVDLALQMEDDFFQEAAAVQALRASQGQTAVPIHVLEEFKSRQQLNKPILKKAMALVGNCMAYLTAYPDDARFAWEADTPVRMLGKLAHGAKEAARTASKLKAMGFLQVHKVGLDFQHSVELARNADHQVPGQGAHAGPKPHWRRGHWRNQAWGPESSLRKLIWMRPTRVLGGPSLSSS